MLVRIRIAGPLVALVLVTQAGCINMLADPLGRRSALKEAQLKYTQAIRWGDFEKAGEFVDPDLRDEFLEHRDAFEAIRITDYDIGPIQYESNARAEVTVTYRAYTLGNFIDRAIRERQSWRREGVGTRWWVTPQIENLVGATGASAP
jgi:hypothetical protein